MVLADVVAGLVVNASWTVGRQIYTGAKHLRGRGKKEDQALSTLLTTYRETDNIGLLDVVLPAGINADGLNELLREGEAQALVQELLLIRLTDAPALQLDRVSDRWIRLLQVKFQTSDPAATELMARQLFEAIDRQACSLAAQADELQPGSLRRLQQEGLYQRIACTLDAIEAHVSCFGDNEVRDKELENEFLKLYKKQLRMAHGTITPPDFDRRKNVPIADLYVSPLFAQTGARSTITLDSLFATIDRTVILGQPGGGKSTATTVLIHKFASAAQAPVPFLIVLRELATDSKGNQSIVEYIESRLNAVYQCPAPAGAVHRLLLSGRAVVFFDGLDELLDTSMRRDVTDAVSLFCNRYPLAKVMVTSRLVGYDQAPMDDRQFRRLEISEFSDDDVRDYVEKWFRQDESLDDGQATQWAESFVNESESVADLRTNPLLLALMCIIYRGEHFIPRNRPAVYERCATMLFEKWDSSRQINLELRAGALVDPAMKHLAYWLLLKHGGDEAVTEGSLIKETTTYLLERDFEKPNEAERAAREFVEFCRGRAWVFSDVGSTADGERLYKFTHRTFMEYFAAYHLSRMSDSPEKLARTLAPKVANEEWDVVAQLAVQIMDKHADRGAERIFEVLLAEKRRRSIRNRKHLLGFLGRCVSFSTVRPTVVRQLVTDIIGNIVDYFESGEFRQGPTHSFPSEALAYLLSGAREGRIEVITDELNIAIDRLVEERETPSKCRLAVELCCYMQIVPFTSRQPTLANTNYDWSAFTVEVCKRHIEFLTDVAREDMMVAQGLVSRGLFDMSDFLRLLRAHGLSALFQASRVKLFESRMQSMAESIMMSVIYGQAGLGEDRNNVSAALTQVGVYLGESEQPPTADMVDIYPSTPVYGDSSAPIAEEMPLTKNEEMAAAVLYCTLLECMVDEGIVLHPAGEPTDFVISRTKLAWLIPFIMTRFRLGPSGNGDAMETPFSGLYDGWFHDWAAGRIQFVGPLPTDAPGVE